MHAQARIREWELAISFQGLNVKSKNAVEAVKINFKILTDTIQPSWLWTKIIRKLV